MFTVSQILHHVNEDKVAAIIFNSHPSVGHDCIIFSCYNRWRTAAIFYKILAFRVVSCSIAAINYRQHCAQRNAPVFNLLRGRFWGFSPTGAIRCTDGGEIRHEGGNRAEFHTIGATINSGIGPQNRNFYWDLIKMWNINAPQGRIPGAIFTKFTESVPRFMMR